MLFWCCLLGLSSSQSKSSEPRRNTVVVHEYSGHSPCPTHVVWHHQDTVSWWETFDRNCPRSVSLHPSTFVFRVQRFPLTCHRECHSIPRMQCELFASTSRIVLVWHADVVHGWFRARAVSIDQQQVKWKSRSRASNEFAILGHAISEREHEAPTENNQRRLVGNLRECSADRVHGIRSVVNWSYLAERWSFAAIEHCWLVHVMTRWWIVSERVAMVDGSWSFVR